jgi:HTH-type transcriptional regulator, competence development regulator
MKKRLNELGDFLRRGREGKGLSLRKVEELTGISNAYLSQLEGAKIQQPSPLDLHKLCGVYELSYSLAMEHAGYPLPEGVAPASQQQRLLARLGPTTPDEADALVDYADFLRSKRRKGK